MVAPDPDARIRIESRPLATSTWIKPGEGKGDGCCDAVEWWLLSDSSDRRGRAGDRKQEEHREPRRGSR
jgi:hypothetical protein